jgi:hypothetical protein
MDKNFVNQLWLSIFAGTDTWIYAIEENKICDVSPD